MADVLNLRDFMCVCSDEPRAKAEACLERVMKSLEAQPGDLLTKVVYTFQWALGDDYVAVIDGIGCDMWCGVSVTVSRMDELSRKYRDHAHIFVQCDRVEHGIARAYELAIESVEGSHESSS